MGTALIAGVENFAVPFGRRLPREPGPKVGDSLRIRILGKAVTKRGRERFGVAGGDELPEMVFTQDFGDASDIGGDHGQ